MTPGETALLLTTCWGFVSRSVVCFSLSLCVYFCVLVYKGGWVIGRATYYEDASPLTFLLFQRVGLMKLS